MIKIRQIQDLVCSYFQISREHLLSSSRERTVVKPRQIAIYLSRELTDASWGMLEREFNRDNSTILHSWRTGVEMERKGIYRDSIRALRETLLDVEGERRRQVELSMRKRWMANIPYCFTPAGAESDDEALERA